MASTTQFRLPMLRSRNRRAQVALAIGLGLLGLLLATSVLRPTSALFTAEAMGGPQATISAAELPALIAVGQGEIEAETGAELVWLIPDVRTDQPTDYQVQRSVAGDSAEVLIDPEITAVAGSSPPAVRLADSLRTPAELGVCPGGWVVDTDPTQCAPEVGALVVYEVTYTKGPWRSAQALEITLVVP